MRMGEWLSGMKRLKIIPALIIIFLVFSAAGTVRAADAGWLAAGLLSWARLELARDAMTANESGTAKRVKAGGVIELDLVFRVILTGHGRPGTAQPP